MALVVACLLGQFAIVGDMAIFDHVTCLEHGEMVHGAGHATPSESHLAGAQPLMGSGGSDRGEEQPHCLIFTERRKAVPGAASPAVLRAPAGVSVDVCVARDARACAWALLRVAPKTSPPRA